MLRRSCFLAAVVVLAVVVFALPAVAQATTVTLRVEGPTGALIPATTVTLPASPVAPAGAPDGQSCPGNSVIGALDAATSGNWSGTWTDGSGWSIDRVKTLSSSSARSWVVYLNHAWLNDAPCSKALSESDDLVIYPKCTSNSISSCFIGDPMFVLPIEAKAGPGVRLQVQAFELTTTFDYFGKGTTAMEPSEDATIWSDEGYVRTNIYGLGVITLQNKGPQTLLVTKGNRVPDRTSVCITDGADGFCGTTVPETVPFDPLNFCVTTGDDGECGTVDTRAPVGHISEPVQAKSFSGSSAPSIIKGTVDFDHSEVAQVKLRLKRQLGVTVTKYVTKKVKVRKRVHGKIRRVTVKKRKPVKRRVTRCYYYSASANDFKALKSCKQDALLFKVNGGDYFQWEFTSPLPKGSYTLDAQAVDGVGNVDAAPELGRNRVTFSVK